MDERNSFLSFIVEERPPISAGAFFVLNVDAFIKKHNLQFNVIPAKAGIQEVQMVAKPLDTRFRGYDGFF